jgi:hypothetical protein
MEKRRRALTPPSSSSPWAWSDWPARRHPAKAVIVGLFLVALITALLLEIPRLLALIGAVVLLLAVVPFYAPTRYCLDEAGVSWSSLLSRQRRAWDSLSYYYVDGDHGVWVSSIGQWGLLARTRGMYLPFADCREPIMAWVDCRLQPGSTSRDEHG